MPESEEPKATADPADALAPVLGASPRLLPRWQRVLLMLLAWFCLVVGFVGFVVPGMPGMVFILLSAWAAMHGSPRLHDWLLAHRLFGPVIRDWRATGAVSRKAKWMATWSMTICAASLFLVPLGAALRSVGIGTMALVLLWLWRRPEPGCAAASANER